MSFRVFEEALRLRAEHTALLSLGGFELRKWMCSEPTLLSDLPVDQIELLVFPDTDASPKILGLSWELAEGRNSVKDKVGVQVKKINHRRSKSTRG